jgi:endonuclease-3
MSNIGWILERMNTEASKKNAPVLRIDKKSTPFKIFVFTMLSARTKDVTTIEVVKRLFKVAKTPKEIASLSQKRLEKLLYGIGFYRVKAKNLIKACRILEKTGIPDTRKELMKLPGVGRKTANIILARAFGKTALGVDVHVHRISNRLGLVRTKKPEDTENALMKKIPNKYLNRLNRDFVAFGQTVCTPLRPKCPVCPINQVCRRVDVKEACEKCKY